MKHFSGAGHYFGASKQISFQSNDASEDLLLSSSRQRSSIEHRRPNEEGFVLLCRCTVNLPLPEHILQMYRCCRLLRDFPFIQVDHQCFAFFIVVLIKLFTSQVSWSQIWSLSPLVFSRTRPAEVITLFLWIQAIHATRALQSELVSVL